MKKKGQELPLRTIIIAIIAVLVLVVILVIYNKQIGALIRGFAEQIKSALALTE